MLMIVLMVMVVPMMAVNGGDGGGCGIDDGFDDDSLPSARGLMGAKRAPLSSSLPTLHNWI
jgi:hypothetical protein